MVTARKIADEKTRNSHIEEKSRGEEQRRRAEERRRGEKREKREGRAGRAEEMGGGGRMEEGRHTTFFFSFCRAYLFTCDHQSIVVYYV